MTPPLAISPGALHVIYSWRGHDFYAITPHPHSPSSALSRTAAPTTAQRLSPMPTATSSPEGASSSVAGRES